MPRCAGRKSPGHEKRRRAVTKAGDEIVNPRTGQRMVFLETGEELLRIDSYNPPSPPLEPEHVHPFQESGAEVISGSLRFRVGGEERSVKAGESITIPANTPHHFWNDGEEEAHSVQWFRPALKIDRFFESYFGLAQDGMLNEYGSPSFWQLAVMAPYFGDDIRTPSPPWAVQRVIFGLLAPIGRLLGYRAQYPYPRARKVDTTR
jgi:mannose-6-phosphate isomerase-like protein (cupin superfamily)